jgi:hypothetical protein
LIGGEQIGATAPQTHLIGHGQRHEHRHEQHRTPKLPEPSVVPNEPTWVQHAAVRQGGLPVGEMQRGGGSQSTRGARPGTHLDMTRALLGVRADPTTTHTPR